MFCVPACKACRETGSCPKGELPVSPVQGSPVRKTFSPRGPHRATRNAAIEKELAAYFTLTCGHLTTRETQVFYMAWRPDKNKHWCETCGKWLKIFPKPKPKPLTTEPLF